MELSGLSSGKGVYLRLNFSCSIVQFRYLGHPMQLNRIAGYRAKAAKWGLLLLVHIDAFRLAPRPYLRAIQWWLRGKRLRGRGQLAPLLSQSPRAYALWVLKNSEERESRSEDRAGAPIVALIDISVCKNGLDETIRSLSAQGVPSLLVGTGSLRTLIDVAAQINWDQNPWLMPITAGDIIDPCAIHDYQDVIDEVHVGDKATHLIYTDDDLLGKGRHRQAPHFKPDWNSELFRYFDYLTGSCIVRTSRPDLEFLANEKHWAQRLISHAVRKGMPLHLRKILHHRRARPLPRIPTATILSHDLPPVTIIIPTRNRVDLLRNCLAGIAATQYSVIEVIIVDNDSDDPETLAYLQSLDPDHFKVLRQAGAFNYSAINNRAVEEAHGQLLCLLNNDIEVVEPNWLWIMAIQSLRKDVGAVGARLLYPDGRIQHAGVVTGVGGGAGHAHRFVHPDEEGYFSRHALPQFTAAVTAACLVIQRERFLAVGGLDESNFPVAFNDVDLCLRLNHRGWQSLYEPRATLIHHESVSRGLDQDPIGAARFAGELAALQRLWNTDSIVDPYHHPQLSRASERFVVGL